jgi:hypothetical protein
MSENFLGGMKPKPLCELKNFKPRRSGKLKHPSQSRVLRSFLDN